ncbi:MAG: sigma-54 dependent transcriptional regulator [Myxococcales bacterium]|nr:sigma-54 dependent transcriptional regulator [Myxococcales bacterium]MDD9965222.1 sigma-54 dependent transcriptional regulator [Myxococcales bacterium]
MMPDEATLLIVDDDRSNLLSLERIFQREGFRTLTAEEGRTALDLCRRYRVHIALTDLMLPGMSGIDLIKALDTVAPDAEVVVMTAYGTVETAVEAMREGAYDFVEKPLKRMQIVKSVRKAAERHALLQENRNLKQELSALRNREIVGSAPALRQALDVAEQAAPSTATVLILGASGTGKELLARRIHQRSGRQGPFIGVNLAALPETIVEAELFGHEKGAFTGAGSKREGRIAQAAGGTLFLDEIGELSQAVQVKLLRVIQEGEYEPLGGKTEHADFRLIAATNRDLREEVDAGRFREDLYYRLNVIAITCPTLGQRKDDVPLLVDHFLDAYCRKNQRPMMNVTEEATQRLIAYDWPGNVRELENVIERAVVLSRGSTLDVTSLPKPIATAEPRSEELVFAVGTPLEEIERRAIHATLKHTDGDKRLAAQLLGIATRTIYRKLAG